MNTPPAQLRSHQEPLRPSRRNSASLTTVQARERPLKIHSEQGFTILELLVAAMLGIMVVGMALATSISAKTTLQTDYSRTKLGQNLRSAIDILGTDIRISGQNMPSYSPAIELIDGGSRNSDELILRRNMYFRVLALCNPVTAGSVESAVLFAAGDGTLSNGTVSGNCLYGDSAQEQNYLGWQQQRIQAGGTLDVYVFDRATGLGEFFKYTGETDSGTSYALTKTAAAWINSYTEGHSSLMILEEKRYRIANGILQVINNQDFSAPDNVVDGIDNMQVTITLENGTDVNAFASLSPWKDIRSINITLTGTESAVGKEIQRSIQGTFYPRNVLSG